LTPEEYFQDSQQIADFLQQHGSKHRQWNPPAPDGCFPEAEWGFEPSLRKDIEAFARENGYRIRRIIFNYPQDLSPLVADLYRWWYQQRDIPCDRLFAESFVYLQPWWTLRLGLVPFWTVFNDRTSANRLDRYLEIAPDYDEIYLTLFSNGIRSLGIASIEEWRSIFNRASRHGDFIGVNEQTYTGDLASFTRHYTELKKLEGRYPIPEPLTLDQLDTFLAQVCSIRALETDSKEFVYAERESHSVRWLEHPLT
jgi:hypothetical protein